MEEFPRDASNVIELYQRIQREEAHYEGVSLPQFVCAHLGSAGISMP
jgi:hypothetical protein